MALLCGLAMRRMLRTLRGPRHSWGRSNGAESTSRKTRRRHALQRLLSPGPNSRPGLPTPGVRKRRTGNILAHERGSKRLLESLIRSANSVGAPLASTSSHRGGASEQPPRSDLKDTTVDRNLTISNTPITTCTQTTHPTTASRSCSSCASPSAEPAAEAGGVHLPDDPCLAPSVRRHLRGGRHVHPSDASRSRQDGAARQPRAGGRHPGRQRPVRWHCDGWPVATPRTAGETNLDGDALQPAPTPAPNDPNCFGYAHRTRRDASAHPQVDHLEGAQRRSTRNLIEQQNADQQSVDHWAADASTPSQ